MHKDIPATLPTCAVEPQIQADRIRLFSLFDQARLSRCEVVIFSHHEPQALRALVDWARDHGRSADCHHFEPAEGAPGGSSWRCDTGMGQITIYVVSK